MSLSQDTTDSTSERRGRRAEPDTLKVEINVARAPIFAPGRSVPMQLALAWPEVHYEAEPWRILQLAVDGPLEVPDLVVFAHLCTRYLWTRSSRRIGVSLTEVARWMGSEVIGGFQRKQARACLRRLCGARFESLLRDGDHVHAWKDWGLIAEAGGLAVGRGQGYVVFTDAMVEQLAAGRVVLVDADILSQLLRRSDLAARLWVYLESHALGHRPLMAVFSAPPGEPTAERRSPAIADLLRLRDTHRRRTVLRLRQACQDIEAVDPRYRLSVTPGARAGLWNLRARRDDPNRAPEVTEIGRPRSREEGDPGNGRAGITTTLSGPDPTRGNRAPEVTPAAGPSRVLKSSLKSRGGRDQAKSLDSAREGTTLPSMIALPGFGEGSPKRAWDARGLDPPTPDMLDIIDSMVTGGFPVSQWITDAPDGLSAYEVIGYCMKRRAAERRKRKAS